MTHGLKLMDIIIYDNVGLRYVRMVLHRVLVDRVDLEIVGSKRLSTDER